MLPHIDCGYMENHCIKTENIENIGIGFIALDNNF